MKFLNKYMYKISQINEIKGCPIAIYGVGRTAKYIYSYLKSEGHNIKFFVDNDPKKQYKKFLDLPIISKNDMVNNNEIKGVITAPRGLNIKSLELENLMHIPIITFDSYYVLKNINEHFNIYKYLLTDKASKKTLKNILKAIVKDDDKYYSNINIRDQYFCIKRFMQVENKYYVDIGAYVGDSIERFIWMNPEFKKIYAFEPMKKQFKALNIRTHRLKEEWGLDEEQIVTENSAIGEISELIKIASSSNTVNFFITEDDITINSNSYETIQIISLDDYFYDKRIDLIKSDIEGFEMKMLNGAVNIIQNQLPKMAICTYHNINDLLNIINFINEIAPKKYKFALRHHSNNFSETVLYCWVE